MDNTKKLLKRTGVLAVLLVALLATMANATVITVDNKETSGAEYTDLQEAIDAASAGDTILIAASPNTYWPGSTTSSFVINKKLVLIGEGYNVQQDQTGFTTKLSGVSLDFVVSPSQDPSGSHFEGIHFIQNFSGEENVHQITLERNRFQSSISVMGNNWTIQHCIIESNVNGSNLANSINIRNNIFKAGIIVGFVKTSVLVSNNLFHSGIKSVGNKFTIFTNNIFYNASIGDTDNSSCDRCAFTNNLSFGSDIKPFAFGNNSFGNNLESTDPLFEDAIDFTFEFSDDYRLQSGSPAIGAGSDGTDIGIYGGAFPYPVSVDATGYVTSLLPRIPRVDELNIENANIPENGTLNVSFKASTSN